MAWVATGFDVLASRVVGGRVRPAGSVRRRRHAHARADGDGATGYVDPGFPMDSAWRGALPPEAGFVHLDDVPARVVLDLAQRGVALAKEHGSAHGPPISLLDQEVVAVSSRRCQRRHPDALRIRLDRNGFPAAVGGGGPGLGLDPDTVAADEIVRVRVLPAWLRIDAPVRIGVSPPRRPRPGAAVPIC